MNRRWLLLLVPALFAMVVFAGSRRRDSGSVATFATAGEPGARLVVSGRVFDESGTRGVPGVELYAYHTDAKGEYGRNLAGQARLRGTVVTDAGGRFEWRTIRPMPYPGGGNPAHIHVEASGGGYPKQGLALEFADDPYLTDARKREARAKGMFAPVVTTSRDARGVLHATFNIRLSQNPSH